MSLARAKFHTSLVFLPSTGLPDVLPVSVTLSNSGPQTSAPGSRGVS